MKRIDISVFKSLVPAFQFAVEVMEIDVNEDCNVIDVDGYYGEVNSFEQYVEVVKALTKKYLLNIKL